MNLLCLVPLLDVGGGENKQTKYLQRGRQIDAYLDHPLDIPGHLVSSFSCLPGYFASG